ncbi:DEAD/DEAH box helicase family protein [Desulfosporosinus sp. FKB]|uniref:DEAD/DEAH box helicase family protein n=1 Tax=Desulfosporosinus sp. FKB TaxID=1969835 RepID=UPI000B49DE62|nr:DEAD/DEAH box helicase family protein [Desulfosporosinus sp. FKB]
MDFYLTLNEDGDVGYTFNQGMDRLPSKVSCLKIPLPLGVIQSVQTQMTKFKKQRHFRLKGNYHERIRSELFKVLNNRDWDVPKLTWEKDFVSLRSETPASTAGKGDDKELLFQSFDWLVRGRQLSWEDLRNLAHELKCYEETILQFAQINVAAKKAEWIPAVLRQGEGWQCQRCGAKDIKEWPSFYGRAGTCLSCMSLGSSTSLKAFYRDYRPLPEDTEKVDFRPHWKLTEAQGVAAEEILDFLKDSSETKALLWAACGSGKTEVCFPSAAWALEQGKSVLFAAPRQDVINDVAPRLKRDFPGVAIQVLTGNAPVKFQRGRVVLATTHQVLRFWQAFDLIVLDEMDAFPYQGNGALEWGLKHALRSNGKLLYLTATPSPEGLKEVHRGKMRLIRLPARHHRFPLPVPIIERFSQRFDPERNPPSLRRDRFESLRHKGRILVFVPKISWIQPWINRFRQCFPEWKIDGSYSSDSERSVKLEKLRQGKFDLFLSTTILERGITLEGIQVVVLGADHPVFDERALVQMAGRVGRTRKDPGGYVLFMAHLETTAIKKAIHWIEDQNRMALEKGLIGEDLKGISNE